MTFRASQMHHLFLENWQDSPANANADQPPTILEVPADGLAFLVQRPHEPPQLIEEQTSALARIALQTIRHDNKLLLLMLVGPRTEVRINSLPAAPVNALQTGDVVDYAGVQFHVTVFNAPYIGVPTDQQLGVECGYCRLKIEDSPNMRVYVCPACGQPMHCQDSDVRQDQRLECAKLAAECGHCRMKIVAEGYTHVPEFIH